MSEANHKENQESNTPLSESEKWAQATEYWRVKLSGEQRIITPQHPDCRCSIVVPVYAESIERIKKQLASIAEQLILPTQYEVIYVVNNSPLSKDDKNQVVISRNQAVIEYLRSVTDAPVYVIDKSSTGNEIDECNVGKARNRGVAEASLRYFENNKNGIIIQTDADTYFEDKEYITSVLTAFDESPDVVGMAGGLVFEFDPDTLVLKERELLRLKIDRLLHIKIWEGFQAFLSGQHEPTSKQTNFSGAHMLSRSYETAVIGGLNDEDFGEDQQFGFDLTKYAKHNNVRVVGMKDELRVITALRDSDRTPASFKKTLDAIDMLQPLVINGEIIDEKKIEEYEKIILDREGGQELIDYIRKSRNLLRIAK